jgi:hypothetical protein
MPHRVRTLLPLLLAVPLSSGLSSCCDLASLWCGPDRSRWVDRTFRTPESAVDTFLESARRDDAETAWRCLSRGFKERSGLTNRIAAEVAWQKLREDNPALHLLGDAQRTGTTMVNPDRARVALTVHGRALEIELVRFPFVFLAYRDPEDGATIPTSKVLPGSLASVLRLPDGETRDDVQISFRLEDLPEGLDPADVELASAGHEWRIDQVTPRESGT